MVDTVKLMLLKGQYAINSADFRYSSKQNGVHRAIRNPSLSELDAGVYLPRCTLVNRPIRGGMSESLIVEFSAPKLLFGNNFDELNDNDFDKVIDRLIKALAYLRIDIARTDVIDAKVVGWHPSKNVVLGDTFGCRTVINALQGVSVSKIYGVQKTDFTDGEVLHFHCNSKDIAFYDKIADLRKSKVSDKRALENHNRIQSGMLEQTKDVSVLRFEIRLNGIRAIKHAYSFEPTFQTLFSSSLSQTVLIRDWRKLTKDIDYLSLDTTSPLSIFEGFLSENSSITPRTALAATASVIIANQVGAGILRNRLDKQFGSYAWRSIRPLIKTPQAHRFKSVLEVDAALNNFKPTRLSMLLR